MRGALEASRLAAETAVATPEESRAMASQA